MNVSIDEFKRLNEAYPDWNSLNKYLDDLKMRTIVSENNPGLAILRYVKGVSTMDVPGLKTSLFRSVVMNTETNTVVCLAPPKAEGGLPPLNTPLTAVEDFLDGFMMQGFMTAENPVLVLATRTQLDGNNTFYSKKTFAQLFEECLAQTPLRTLEALADIFRQQLQLLGAASVFGSFVVQHPDHRIVTKHRSPDLNMVHFGWTMPDKMVYLQESSELWSPALKRLQIPRYPISDTDSNAFQSEEEITNLMRRTSVNNGFCWQGLVFKDGTGRRWKLRTNSYTMLRTLRAGEATSVERFLRLRKQGKVVEYLKHYSEERELFWSFESTLRARTNDILSCYNSFAKERSVKFADLATPYKPGVHMLHNHYLTVLRPKNAGSIKLANAISIVNSMKPFEQRRLIEAEPLAPVVAV
jgi:hypothetical protein